MRSSVSFPPRANNGETGSPNDTRTPADVSDAAYLIAHNHPGGVRVLAERMGVSANTLQNKLNPNNTTHHLTLRESVALQVMSGNPAILHAMAAALGYTCVPALPDQAAGDPVEAFVALQQEVGEFTSAAADAFRGGKVMVSRNEIKRLQYRYNELISTLNQLLATAAARVPAPAEEG